MTKLKNQTTKNPNIKNPLTIQLNSVRNIYYDICDLLEESDLDDQLTKNYNDVMYNAHKDKNGVVNFYGNTFKTKEEFIEHLKELDRLKEDMIKNPIPLKPNSIGIQNNSNISSNFSKGDTSGEYPNIRHTYHAVSKLKPVENHVNDNTLSTVNNNTSNFMDAIHNPYVQMAAAAGTALVGYGAHKYFKNKK